MTWGQIALLAVGLITGGIVGLVGAYVAMRRRWKKGQV